MPACPTCAADLPPDAIYCHICGRPVNALPDRAEQLRVLEMRLMEAETSKAEIESRWLRERDGARTASAKKSDASRALSYNLVGVAVLLLMLAYLFACAMWLRQTVLEGQNVWVLVAFAVAFVLVLVLLVCAEIMENAARKAAARENEQARMP